MTDEIHRWRDEIDALDERLLELLNARARAALRIAACKRDAGLPIFDREREREVLARVRARNGGPFDARAVERLFVRVIHESRMLEGGADADAPALVAAVRP